MEILFKGEVVEESWYGECSFCHSILKSKKKEMLSPHNIREYGSARCPVCNGLVDFYPEYTGSAKNIKNKVKKR